MAYRFFPGRVFRYHSDGKINLCQALTFFWNHLSSLAQIKIHCLRDQVLPGEYFHFHCQLASRFFEDIYLFGVPRAGADLGQDPLRHELP